MYARLSDEAIEVPVDQFSPDLVGATFAYQGADYTYYGKIASLELRASDHVRLSVSGVVADGNSLVISLSAGDSIWIEPEL